MGNYEKQMTGEESLQIITDMINKTKVSIGQGSFHLLFWGWLIFACSLTEYLLVKTGSFEHPYYIWLFVIPGIFVSMIYGFTKGRREKVYTYASSVYTWSWIAFMLGAIVLFVVNLDNMESFTSLILTMTAIPTLISGIILRFRPLIAGAAIFWIIAVIAKYGGPEMSGLSMPVAMLLGYLIPGYLLKKRKNDTV